MKKLIALMVLLSTPALAQQLGPSYYTLRLSGPMLNQIGTALDELPGHERKPIVDFIMQQVREQNAVFAKSQEDAKEAAKKSEEEKAKTEPPK